MDREVNESSLVEVQDVLEKWEHNIEIKFKSGVTDFQKSSLIDTVITSGVHTTKSHGCTPVIAIWPCIRF